MNIRLLLFIIIEIQWDNDDKTKLYLKVHEFQILLLARKSYILAGSVSHLLGALMNEYSVWKLRI